MNVKEVLEGCKNNDQRCNTALYKFFINVAGSIPCKYYGLQIHESDDILQDVFIKVLGLDLSAPNEASLSRFLQLIVRNATIDCLRKRKSASLPIEDVVEEVVERKYEFPEGLLENYLSQLPYRYSNVIRMKYFEKMTFKEISEKLLIGIGTCKRYDFMGRQLLRKDLEKFKIRNPCFI